MREPWLVLVPTWPRADGLSGAPGMSPACNYRAYSNWSLATYPFFSSSKLELNITASPSNLCWEANGVLISIHNTFRKLLKRKLGSLDLKKIKPWLTVYKVAPRSTVIIDWLDLKNDPWPLTKQTLECFIQFDGAWNICRFKIGLSWWNLASKSVVGEIFQGELLFRILPTILLQLICKIIPNFKVIVISIVGPDENS